IVSVLPFAITPLAVDAVPATTASAPRMWGWAEFAMKAVTGDCIFGFRSRLMAAAKFAAVTAAPLLNRYPLLMVNVYVFPSLETVGSAAATSGISFDPAGAGLSA